MLKQLTKYDYREQFCAALRSGKYHRAIGLAKLKSKTLSTRRIKACAIQVGMYEGLWEHRGRTPSWPSYTEATDKLGICAIDIAILNDEGWSFRQIADWIEAQP